MADEAFALSPISARGAQPCEADYEAIREAFMETARGRWFLGEYAKRNRNADTCMVLDGVARIEQKLEAMQQSAPDTRVAEIFSSFGQVLDEATEVAAPSADGGTIDDRLAPIHRGAKILKDICWRWREVGAESRICDSIEFQVEAIQDSCSQLAKVDTPAAFKSAIQIMRTRLEQLARENGLAIPPDAKPSATFDSAGSDAVTVARPIESAPAQAGSCAVSAATQFELPANPRSELHPSLGSTPFTVDDLEPHGPPELDPAAAIRRMTLIEKIAFFA